MIIQSIPITQLFRNVSSDVQIGSGSSARVFKGVDRATQQAVAIKSMFFSHFFDMDIFISLTGLPQWSLFFKRFLVFFFLFFFQLVFVDSCEQTTTHAKSSSYMNRFYSFSVFLVSLSF